MKQVSNILKNPLFLLVVGVIVIAIIAYFTGKGSKKGVQIKPMPHLTLWGGGITQEDSSDIRSYSDLLYQDMTEIWGTRNMEVYIDLLAEDDGILTGVYNDFNSQYAELDEGSLTQWIQDEVFIGSNQQVTKDALLSRMIGLNLS
tara:strand:+ start:4741 stop:5175 length:435 start_codon:yes stop_codon:yes gene_type:complete